MRRALLKLKGHCHRQGSFGTNISRPLEFGEVKAYFTSESRFIVFGELHNGSGLRQDIITAAQMSTDMFIHDV